MARISPVPDRKVGWLGRFAAWMSARRAGKRSDSFALLAHNKRVLTSVVAFMATNQRWNSLPRRLKRLVHLRVAMRVGCPF